MRWNLLSGLATIGACIALHGCAQDSPAAPPGSGGDKVYTLQLRSAVGDFFEYKTTINMKMEMKVEKGEIPLPTGADILTSTIMRYKTVAVKPDGSIVQVIETRGGTMKVLGREIPMPKTPPARIEIDMYGRSKPTGPAGAGPEVAMSQFMNPVSMAGIGLGVVLPEKPVTVGESWTIEAPPGIGEGRLKITSTLVAVEMLNGKTTLKIKELLSMPIDIAEGADGAPTKATDKATKSMKGTLNGQMMSNVLEENGRTIATTGDIRIDVTFTFGADAATHIPSGSQGTMKMTGKVTMELLSSGKTSDMTTPVVKKPAPNQRTP